MGIIFLNGCTSAGKTSIARALQARDGPARLHFGIDDGFRLVPDRFHNHAEGFFFDRDDAGLVRLNHGATGRMTLAAYRRAAVAIAAGELDLIVDEVLLEADFADDWVALAAGLEVFAVGVHCALPELERREIQRGDRCHGQARGQLGRVHTLIAYDFELDTTAASPAEAAAAIDAALASASRRGRLRRR